MSMIKAKTGHLMTVVFCLMALSFTALASVTDPDIISSVLRVNGADTAAAVVVKGGLITGALPYIDRTSAQAIFSDVDSFSGMDYIQTAGADKNDTDVQYQVTLNKAGTLYLFIDNRVGDNVATDPPTLTSIMTWVTTMGFTSTGNTIDLGTGTTPATVYALPVAAAGTITLLQNDTTNTSRTMYGIAAAPSGWNRAPSITGVPSTVAQRTNILAINATITDDGVPAPPALSILWTTVSKPAGSTVTYAPNETAEDPTITFSAYGVYTIKVTATDGEKTTEKTMQVTIANTFAVAASQRVIACNDVQYGPTYSYTSSQLHLRNDPTTRRRVSYCRYSIASAKEAGKVFANCYLTWEFASRTSNRNAYVYGIKEEIDNVSLAGMSWSTAPGIQNTPVPPLGSVITIDTLDKPDLSPLLLSYIPATTGTWLSTPPSVNLDDLLNGDTDGDITLMFITYEPETTNFQIYDQTSSPVEPVTGLKGVILRGNMTTPIWAHEPIPKNNSTTNDSLSQLSWTNPDPNLPAGVITCDVYFHEVDNDPNTLDDPNYILPDYGYTTLAPGITGNSVTLPPGAISGFRTYKWIVDVHDTTRQETTKGYLWTFDTNNGAPTANAGTDQYVWLNNAGNPTSATVNLDGTTSDDGLPSGSYTRLWTQLSGPTVTINPNNVDDTTVVLPAGTYQFRLTADDGDLQTSDSVQIVVSATPCAAAKAMPGYTPIVGDFDGDCYVSLSDLKIFAGNWLECSSLAPCN